MGHAEPKEGKMNAASARLNMRVKEDALDRIRTAADITGTDVTAFVISAATAEARKVIMEERVLRLSNREVDQLVDLMAEDRGPSTALVEAARRLSEIEETTAATPR